AMIDVARRRHPTLDFRVGTMTRLEVPDASWAGLVGVYPVIHPPPPAPQRAYRELARVPRPGGWVLVAFHIDSAILRSGASIHLDEFLGHPVDLDGYSLPPEGAAAAPPP